MCLPHSGGQGELTREGPQASVGRGGGGVHEDQPTEAQDAARPGRGDGGERGPAARERPAQEQAEVSRRGQTQVGRR